MDRKLVIIQLHSRMKSTRWLNLLVLLCMSAGALSVPGILKAQKTYDDCRRVIYYDDIFGQDELYTEVIPTTRFAVRVTPDAGTQIDTIVIGFAIVKTPATRFTPDTVLVEFLEDVDPLLDNVIEERLFRLSPVQGGFPLGFYNLELNTQGKEPPKVDFPPREFWVAWRFKGPKVDSARIQLRKPSKGELRHIVLDKNSNRKTISNHVYWRTQDSVDLKFEARLCYAGIPVEFHQIRVNYVGGLARLEWRTENEENNFGFYIERLVPGSDHISLWERIGFVPASGEESSAPYSFEDPAPAVALQDDGTVRYRLKQVDYDGQQRVSPVQILRLPTETASFSLGQSYPNPGRGDASIAIPFSLKQPEAIRLTITDPLGREIMTLFDGELNAGSHALKIPAGRLQSGMYLYRLESGDQVVSRLLSIVD
ncbi:MAG: hypothetical protein CL946_04850 [Ectothiorhodospiraceae bacterium]|nr:hypothetical protein [Ectothiorhodospiraceae bacterium]